MAEIQLMKMPLIPGLLFRAFAGESDLPRMHAVREGCREWDRIDRASARENVPSLADLQNEWAAIPPGYPHSLFAEVNDELIGYNQLSSWTEEDGTVVYLTRGWLLPAWRGKGIGWTLLHWAENRAREFVLSLPDRSKGVLAANASSTEREATTLLLNEDYKVVRRLSDMEYDLQVMDNLSVPPLPPGLTLRPPLPDHYPAIYAALKDAFAGQWGTTKPGEADYQEFLADNVNFTNFDPALWQIAWQDEQVVGLVLGRRHSPTMPVGVVTEVGVRPAWRRQGLARALLLGSLAAMHDKGFEQARLYTNAENHIGARSLYEAVGFREVKQFLLYRKPLETIPR